MTDIHCDRCKTICKLGPAGNSRAKMLRLSKEAKGLCINCAVHDWLRNTYPVNILLAQSGPKGLLCHHIQEQFFSIMKLQFADAKPDEINWQKIVDNWDLPFPTKIKSSGMNPVRQKELDEISSGKRKAFYDSYYKESKAAKTLRECNGCITSFEQLNDLSPGLGDQFRQALNPSNP